jgi:hypothetical protein
MVVWLDARSPCLKPGLITKENEVHEVMQVAYVIRATVSDFVQKRLGESSLRGSDEF